MSKQVAWTKFIYETFCEEAMLNENDVEFYWSLAYDFITDADAPAHKVAKYFSM